MAATTDALAEADRLRAWLRQVIERSGMRPSRFAKHVGLAPSTILRTLEPGSTSMLDLRTITRICTAFGLPPPADPRLSIRPLLVDGERVRIAAVVVRMQRWPRKTSTS